MKAFMQIVEILATKRDFHFSIDIDENGKRTMRAVVVIYSDAALPRAIPVPAAVLDQWGLDLEDWADNLESLGEAALSGIDGVAEKT